MTISFGKNPQRPKLRSWAVDQGFSWIEWLNSEGHVLNKAPQVNERYSIRVLADFVASVGETITLSWLPADSSINGFDQSNIAEIKQLRFLSGTVSPSSDIEKAFVFEPVAVRTPLDLLALESRPITLTDTLTDCQRSEYSIGRFRHVEFSMEGDVTSRYVLLDDQLIMLDHCVWSDAHFWIGNGKLTPPFASKVLPKNE